MLRDAGATAAARENAVVHIGMDADGDDQAVLDGHIDLSSEQAEYHTSDAHQPPRYPPFASRCVGGWSYVEIDPAVLRPPQLRSTARWVAVQGHPAIYPRIPIPDRTTPPCQANEMITQLRTGDFTHAAFVKNAPNGRTQIRFTLPRLAKSAGSVSCVATIDGHGVLVSIALVDHFVANGIAGTQGTTLRFTWVHSVPAVTAPPASVVYRLAPGEDLYPPTPTQVPTP